MLESRSRAGWIAQWLHISMHVTKICYTPFQLRMKVTSFNVFQSTSAYIRISSTHQTILNLQKENLTRSLLPLWQVSHGELPFFLDVLPAGILLSDVQDPKCHSMIYVNDTGCLILIPIVDYCMGMANLCPYMDTNTV